MPRKKATDGPQFGIPPDLVVGPDAQFLPLAGEVNWGMATFGVDVLRTVTKGEGVITGVIDTGVDRTHPLLSNVFASKNFASRHSGDRNGHGTHCTGTVGATDPRIGVAIGARLCHAGGLGDSGNGSDTALNAAMDWCVEQGAEILSCSWGSSAPAPSIIDRLKGYADEGIWPVFAAGNSGGNTPDVDWPGRSEYCIDVAALAADLSPASFTSAGAKIDTAGPGVGIWSTKTGGGFRQMSGTSMATPFVAGLLTLYRSALKLRGLPIPRVDELRRLLFSRSTDTHTPGDDRRTGPGWVTPLLLVLSLTPLPPPVRSTERSGDDAIA